MADQINQEKKTSGMAITAMILGIVSVCGGGLLFFPPVLAIVFAAIALSNIGKNPSLQGKGMGIAGLVLGIVSCVGYLIYWLIAGAAIMAGFMGLMKNV